MAAGRGVGALIEMSVFTEAELAYLFGERRLARIATVGRDGTPHVAPVGWRFDAELGVIEVGGRALGRTKKFRDVSSTGRAAVVIDDVLPPWHPRGIEIRGRAEAISHPMALIRIHPERIVSWGIESDMIGIPSARTIPFHEEGEDV